MAKHRKTAPARTHVTQSGVRPGFSRRPAPVEPRSRFPSTWIVAGLVGAVAVLVVLAYALGFIPGSRAPSPSPTAGPTPGPTVDRSELGPPAATPLANPPAEPAGDGTRATIETALGNIVLELYTESSPVAAENFINLAEAGYYDGVVFHRIVPDFVIQGGDPEGTGQGGPGYEILDDPVVGEYVRAVVAMARPGNPDGSMIPDSQGSQFFIVLDDTVKDRLPKSGGYSIFANVVEGMEIVDQIAAGPADGQTAINPVVMTMVTIDRP